MPRRSRAASIFLDLYQLNPVRPDLKQLGEVAGAFARLPWENLTKFLKKHAPPAGPEGALPPELRGTPGAERLRLPDEVLDDHARWGTGGTCFSLTEALRRIVTDLGFRGRPVMADMRHGANIHCGLLVELDGGRFLLDPGYLVAEPVPLHPGRSVRVRLPGHDLEYRALADHDAFELHTINARGESQLRYRLRPQPVSDREFVGHWLASFDAVGMNGLHLNRLDGDARLSAHDCNLRIDRGRDKVNVKLRDGYVEQVSQRFGLDRELVRQAFGAWERSRCRT